MSPETGIIESACRSGGTDRAMPPDNRTPTATGAATPPARTAYPVTAVWTGAYSATVQLARVVGPAAGDASITAHPPVQLPGCAPWRLSDPGVREAIYTHCLTVGTPFDIYRWIDLDVLAEILPTLPVSPAIRNEWRRALEGRLDRLDVAAAA